MPSVDNDGLGRYIQAFDQKKHWRSQVAHIPRVDSATQPGRLFDPRKQSLIRYPLDNLIRERTYAMALGYSAQDDVDQLAHDPAFRTAVWGRNERTGLARERA